MTANPWDILGLTPGSTIDEQTVRAAWRSKAKQYHPDFNASPDAAKEFAAITRARDTILQRIEFKSNPSSAAAAAAMRRQWATTAGRNNNPVSNPNIKRRAAVVFSAASFVVGCGLFIGAIMTYNVFDRYYYSNPDRVEERLRAYNPQRERLLDRIVQERAELVARRSVITKPSN